VPLRDPVDGYQDMNRRSHDWLLEHRSRLSGGKGRPEMILVR
jgi:hypothetical protein